MSNAIKFDPKLIMPVVVKCNSGSSKVGTILDSIDVFTRSTFFYWEKGGRCRIVSESLTGSVISDGVESCTLFYFYNKKGLTDNYEIGRAICQARSSSNKKFFNNTTLRKRYIKVHEDKIVTEIMLEFKQ